MNILFVSHYYFPEGNAPATRVHQMTRVWAGAGHNVTVITAVPNVPSGVPYEGYRNRWRQREVIDGVTILRVWTFLAANAGTFRRVLSYLSFMITALLAGLSVRRPDVVVATSPQFFCGWAGRLIAGIRRLPFVLEIRDLWPASIVTVGAMRRSPTIRFIEWLEKRLYRAAQVIVTVGSGYCRKLVHRGVPREKVEIISNGVDLGRFAADMNRGAMREELDIGERFTCAFVGTIGMAAGLDVVIRTARMLKATGRDDVRFLLVGDGAERPRLEALARAENLSSIHFTGRLPKARIPDAIAAADVCLVHLMAAELFESVLPSKMFEAAAMRKPIILGVRGDAAEWLDAAGGGIAIDPEDENQLLAAIDRLAANPVLRDSLGDAGRAFVTQWHDHELLAAKYLDLLSRFSNGDSAR